MQAPYQPSLLRLLHGATSLLVAGAWLSGLVLLLTLDRRWGSLPLDLPGEWVDGRRLGCARASSITWCTTCI